MVRKTFPAGIFLTLILALGIGLATSAFAMGRGSGGNGGGGGGKPPKEDMPPTVEITSPDNFSTVSGTVTITAKASDDVGVTKVEFFVDHILIATDVDGSDGWSAQWTTWPIDDGVSRSIVARAYDTASVWVGHLITVTVDNVMSPPIVSITGPTDGSMVSGRVTIAASASADLGVSEVQFYVDSALIATDTKGNNGWSTVWRTSNKDDGIVHSITAIVVDEGGSKTSDSILVIVDNVAGPPAIAITDPAPGSEVSNTVTITAIAGDQSGISLVRFFIDGGPLDTDSDGSNGWSAQWVTQPNDNEMQHLITATAVDNENQSASASITVFVDNVPDVAFVYPSDGGTVSGHVFVMVDVPDEIFATFETTEVRFFVDEQPLSTDLHGEDGWNAIWVTPSVEVATTHTITATAIDGDLEASKTVTVTVDNTAIINATLPVYERDRTAVADATIPWMPVASMRWVVVDVDGDGLDDVLHQSAQITNQPDPNQPMTSYLVYRNLGDGGFELIQANSLIEGDFPDVTGEVFVSADFNGDGKLDVYVVNSGPDAPPYPGAQNLLFLSRPSGGLVNATGTLPALSDWSTDAAAGDVDGDGDVDLLVVNTVGGTIIRPYFLINNGQGGFSFVDNINLFPPEFRNGGLTHFMVAEIADSNDDGSPDLIMGLRPGFQQLTGLPGAPGLVFHNNGSGDFSTIDPLFLPAGVFGDDATHSVELVSLDVNDDEILDILLSQNTWGYAGARVQVLIGNGDGTYRDESFRFPTSFNFDPAVNDTTIVRLEPIDFNDDGAVDMLLQVRQFGHAKTTVFANDGSGFFREVREATIPNAMTPGFQVSGDLDYIRLFPVRNADDELEFVGPEYHCTEPGPTWSDCTEAEVTTSVFRPLL